MSSSSSLPLEHGQQKESTTSRQHDAPSIVLEEPPAKRQREEKDSTSLPLLCLRSKWNEARQRALDKPEEALWTNNIPKSKQTTTTKRRLSSSVASSTPLALACRQGAPYSCIKAILQASPMQLRRLIPSYGTPLHEAIVCDDIHNVNVIELLCKVDEELGGDLKTRAALLQDVDGHTPLHLLIRRRFQSSSSSSSCGSSSQDTMMAMLQCLVKSCPEAVQIPDCGEYEEPPLVMALKANIYSYAAAASSEEDQSCYYETMELRIHEMVKIMLDVNPRAAGRVLKGARGQYTALHSAVFHGRCSDTIRLLLEASATSKQALELANTQGELPLHFCAMRGEPPRSIELLATAAPLAVLKRDTSGLTPMHWLWIRFVSTLLSLEDATARNNNSTTETTVQLPLFSKSEDIYSNWSQLEQGEFYTDLKLIRKLDPPVDFLRMRHIPPELLGEDGGEEEEEWANRTAQVLQRIRTRYYQTQERVQSVENAAISVEESASQEEDACPPQMLAWTRQEAVSALFWTKVVSLLRAANGTTTTSSVTDSPFLVTHAAMATFACPPSVVQIITRLFPQELTTVDSDGKLPLHHAAASRNNDFFKKQQEELLGTTLVPFLKQESLSVLKHCMAVSPPQAARVADKKDKRLVLHHAIDTFVKACCSRSLYHYWYSPPTNNNNEIIDSSSTQSNHPVENMLRVLKQMLKMYPDSLERRDGKTKLYPFLQATAAATTEYKKRLSLSPNDYLNNDEAAAPLSIVYLLLRENPSLVKHYHD